MVHLVDGPARPRRARWRIQTGITQAITLTAVLLLSGALVACSGQTAKTPPKSPPGLGAGGGEPYWNTAGTGGASSAIAWAELFQAGHPNAAISSKYAGWCLWFVANAYGAEKAGYDSAWILAQQSTLHDPTNPAAAPRGALMFFDLTHPPAGPSYTDGHVGISLGGGAMISSHTQADYVRITQSVQTDTYWRPTYRGWAWPPAQWGPLARQAAAGQNAVASKPKPPVVQPAGGGSSLQPAGGGSSLQPAGGGGSLQPAGGIPSTPPQPVTPAPQPVTPAPQPVTPAPQPPTTYPETTGGVAHTWTNYSNAGGTAGPIIGGGQTVQIACKVTGFRVADGNTWWYRIAQAPWSNQFYVSADAFYNNGATSGSLSGTPYVDPKVPNC